MSSSRSSSKPLRRLLLVKTRMAFLDKFNDFRLLNDKMSTGMDVRLLSLKSKSLREVKLTTVSGVNDDMLL